MSVERVIHLLAAALALGVLGCGVNEGAQPPDAATSDAREAADSQTIDAMVDVDALPSPVIRSLRFDGVDDVIIVAGDPSFRRFDALTVEAWIKPMWSGTSRRAVLGKLFADTDLELAIFVTPDPSTSGAAGRVTFAVGCQRFDASITSANDAVPSGQWTHVAGVYAPPDANTGNAPVRLYVNGQLASEVLSASVDCMGDTLNDLFLGQLPAGNAAPWQGGIDEVRVWATARTQSELQAGMSSQVTGSEPGLVSAWSGDDGSGDSLLDASTAANHGRLGTTAGSDAADPQWSTDTH